MPYYSIKNCPKCGKVIELGQNYIAIGNPMYKCVRCGQLIKLKHINEWDGLGFMGKFGYILSSLWTVFLYSFLPAAFLIEFKNFEPISTFLCLM